MIAAKAVVGAIMEIEILNAIQTWHNEILDKIMIFASTIGDNGFIWIVAALVLLCMKKYRIYGAAVLLALLLGYIGGNVILKNLFMRQRPNWLYPEITLLIVNPHDYSFPSGHTQAAFAAAVSLLYMNKRIGIAALVLAAVIGFSRLYLYVHFPSDVLLGMLFGIFWAIAAHWIIQRIGRKRNVGSNCI